MPTYVYKFVDTGETIEVQQAFTDDALSEAAHPDTGVVMPVKKVFTPVGVTFRGGGFYKTDSRGKSSSSSTGSSSPSEGSSGDSAGSSSSSSDSSSSSSSDSASSSPKTTSSADSGSKPSTTSSSSTS